VLQKIAMPIISNPTCESFYGKYKITTDMFCGALISGENAIDITPNFNEGAPMACEDEETGGRYLCGIHSLTPIYNALCDGPVNDFQGFPGYPTAFVDVRKYVDWINEVISA
jgi:hypothetical protein